jgi:hypothetical protein
VAVADVVERVPALELLVAGVDVDRRVALAAAGVVVEVVAVDVDVDAADVVDGAPEGPELDADHVVDREVVARRVLEQLLDRLDGQPLAAVLERGVDLVAAVAGDLDGEVARDRHDGDRVAVGVGADEQHRVRARLEPELLVVEAGVGAEQQDRARAAGLGARDLGDVDLHAALPEERLRHVVDLEHDRGRERGPAHRHDEEHRQQRALDDRRADVRRLVLVLEVGLAHARPPSTARSGMGASAAAISSSLAGSCTTKSVRAWR